MLLRNNRNSNSLDSDCLLWVNAVVTNGGSVSVFRSIIVSNFIRAEKASGAWFLTDDYWGLWGENEIQALTSIKQLRLATAVNSPVFTADRGYATDGATNYIDTLFVPSTHSLLLTPTSNHIEIYERSSTNVNAYSCGANSTVSRLINLRTRFSSSFYVSAVSASGGFLLPVLDSKGLTQGGRDGTLVSNVYGNKNGVDASVNVVPASVGTTLPIVSILIGCYNNAGVAAGFRNSSFGYMSCGAALSVSQRLTRYQNVQAWATAVGAQV